MVVIFGQLIFHFPSLLMLLFLFPRHLLFCQLLFGQESGNCTLAVSSREGFKCERSVPEVLEGLEGQNEEKMVCGEKQKGDRGSLPKDEEASCLWAGTSDWRAAAGALLPQLSRKPRAGTRLRMRSLCCVPLSAALHSCLLLQTDQKQEECCLPLPDIQSPAFGRTYLEASWERGLGNVVCGLSVLVMHRKAQKAQVWPNECYDCLGMMNMS